MQLALRARRSLGLGCVTFLMLSACSGGEEAPPDQPTAGALALGGKGGSSGSGVGGTLAGGAPLGGSSSGAFATGSGAGGKPTGSAGSGGARASAGAPSLGGSPGAGGSSSPSGGSGGSPNTPSAGSGGSATPTGGTGGGGSPAGCTRELLDGTVDAYFKALAAHDPSMLPLADTVKFTEDGESFEVGEKGLWKTAGAVKYAHSALDTEKCMSATEAVVPDGTTDIPFALRLKLENQKITEIETIAVQKGDYAALASDTAALINNTVKWEESVPEADRATREELTSWMDKYFRMFPRGVCNTTSDCKRRENGGGNFNCSTGASCASGAPTGNAVMEPRLILADVERGLGVGFTMFQGTHTDMHMFKMSGGQVHAVYAILAAADGSGWD